ncbi:MAG TPA: hypothetical protein VGG38_14900 [Acidimicrobiales bacterium]|jgi:hypothetical protein
MPAPSSAPTAVASATFSVDATIVWAYRLNFENLPDYNPDVSELSRVNDGDGVGGVHGQGARYQFELADARKPGVTHAVELWTQEVVEPSLVSAGMRGPNDAYEEFVVRERPVGCQATLTLWVSLPPGLSDSVLEAAAAGSLVQLEKELTLMQQVLEGPDQDPSVH